MSKAITAKRIAKAPTTALERLVMVQEAQIRAQANALQRLRKEKEALKAAIVALCLTDDINQDTGEIARIIQFF